MRSLPPERARFLGVVARRIVPDLQKADSELLGRFYSLIDLALMERPPSVRRRFGTFLGLIRWRPLLRHGTPFERLDGVAQDALLWRLQESRLRLLRQGFWGLKTLVFMGYYGQPGVGKALGYRPRSDGNEALGG